jgi:hypothetical protein
VQSCPARDQDFWSDYRAGRTPRAEQITDRRLYVGISVWKAVEDAEGLVRAARQFGWTRLGHSVVTLRIRAGESSVFVHKTRGPGHYTLIAPAELLLSCVVPGSCYDVH